jgi:DNA-binding protein YbaB
VDPNQIVAAYENEVAAIAARAEEARDRISNLTGTATSPDGAVTITVGGAGALQSVSFGRRADELPREQLAAVIMATARHAQANASQQVLAIMAPLVGEDSDAMRFVREQIPDPVEPEEEIAQSYPGRSALEEEPDEPAPPRPARTARHRAVTDGDDDDFAAGSPLSREEGR